jgi:two-component system sensor histidine kinase/response regulator
MDNDRKEVPKGNILVVDDNRNNLRVLTEILSEHGYLVRPVPESSRAISSAQTEPPDIILLDIKMPEISGYEVCEQLKTDERTRDIPVIFISALQEVFDKVKAFAVGGVDYLTKPFQREELLARVHTHLTIQKQQRYIQHQNQLLQELNVNKDKFFSIIAHDLKSPLAGLLLFTSLITEKIDSWSTDEIKHNTTQLKVSMEHLYALLENLLTWARAQQGLIDYQPQALDISHIVTKNITLLAQNAEQKQITLTHAVPTQTAVYADVDMMDTVIRNLLSNAIKFTRAGGIVEISARSSEKTVEIAVSDTGIGINPEKFSRLFRIESKYQRLGTAGEKGTGLGLILCQEFIAKHGGNIGVESEPGKGTTFTFTLPKTAS